MTTNTRSPRQMVQLTDNCSDLMLNGKKLDLRLWEEVLPEVLHAA